MPYPILVRARRKTMPTNEREIGKRKQLRPVLKCRLWNASSRKWEPSPRALHGSASRETGCLLRIETTGYSSLRRVISLLLAGEADLLKNSAETDGCSFISLPPMRKEGGRRSLLSFSFTRTPRTVVSSGKKIHCFPFKKKGAEVGDETDSSSGQPNNH